MSTIVRSENRQYILQLLKNIWENVTFFNIFYFFQYIILFVLNHKFDKNGLYYCRVLNYEQIQTKPMPIAQKLRKKMGFEGSPNFGGFLGVGAKCLEHKNIPFYSIINPEKIKDLSSNECFFLVRDSP